MQIALASEAGISFSETMAMDDVSLLATVLIVNEWNEKASKANN